MRALMLEWLRPALSLHGHGGLHDRLALGAWDLYARLRGGLHLGRDRTPAEALYLGRRESVELKARYWDADFYRAHIVDQLLPFWAHHAADSQYGGFITHLDRQGQVYDDTFKTAAMQARMVFGFAIGYELCADLTYLRLAEEGVRFLIERLWDPHAGGWYQEVWRDGRVKVTDKSIFAQAYVLIGLAEYCRVTHDPIAWEHACRTYDLLEQAAWDKVNGGYYETCSADWQPVSSAKTICIQLDMLMAALCLYGVTPEEHYFQRAWQLADLIATRMRDPRYGCVLERFSSSWVYDPVSTRDRLQMGHNLKTAWLLLRLFDRTHVKEYFSTASEVLEYCLRCGWDETYGGFYQHVYRNGVLAKDVKEWWPECEGLQALSLLCRLSGEPRYREYFERLAAFTFAAFWDREYGEWVRTCYPSGAVQDACKGGNWKAAYHTVQACYEVLNNLGRGVPDPASILETER